MNTLRFEPWNLLTLVQQLFGLHINRHSLDDGFEMTDWLPKVTTNNAERQSILYSSAPIINTAGKNPEFACKTHKYYCVLSIENKNYGSIYRWIEQIGNINFLAMQTKYQFDGRAILLPKYDVFTTRIILPNLAG